MFTRETIRQLDSNSNINMLLIDKWSNYRDPIIEQWHVLFIISHWKVTARATALRKTRGSLTA